MGVDVVDFVGLDAGVLDGPADGAHGACAVGVGHDKVVGVGAGAEAGELDLEFGAAGAG